MEKGRISGLEAILLMTGFIFGSSLILSPGRGAEQQAWQAILLGLAEGTVFALIYTALMMRFPGKTMIEIADTVYGSVIGKMISIPFIGFLFHLGSLVVRNYLDFIKLEILTATPSSVVLFVGLLVCAYAAHSGVEVMSRCSQGLVILTIILFLLITLLLSMQIRLEKLLPFFSVPAGQFLWAAHGVATFPFGETVVFMMVLPFLNRKQETRGIVLKALLIGGVILALASARTTSILGGSAKLFLYPDFQAARLIDVGGIFTRMEIILATDFLMMGFIKITALLYGTSLGVAQLFRVSGFRPLVFPLGVLMFLTALMNFYSVSENVELVANIWPVYSLPFILGLPLLTLIVAGIRRLPRRNQPC